MTKRESGPPRPLALHASACAAFVAATLGAMLAYQSERPVTSALIYLFGVILIGAIVGVRGGLVGAVAASLIYNFFFSDPVFRFSLRSADEYVPLIAFAVSAIASGTVSGRLRDRARAAELTTERVAALLEVSEALQHVVRLDEIVPAVSRTKWGRLLASIELYLVREAERPEALGSSAHQDCAERLLRQGHVYAEFGPIKVLLIAPAAPARAVLVVAGGELPLQKVDIEALASLISMAFARSQLLAQLSDAELVKRSEELKTALLSSVSHDMRTPLSAISASATSLLSYGSDLSPETRTDLLRMIQEQCDRLDRYTSNLLNLVRLQAGVNPESFTLCDAIEVLGGSIAAARLTRAEPRIVRDLQVASAVVRADPVMLEQIFLNVLENALRYSPSDSSVLVSSQGGPDTIIVQIVDQGPGIDEEDRERVFDRFYRSRSAVPGDGSGLGLSIAKGFTEAFGGSISAARIDTAHGGTVVTITLPLARQGERAK